MERKKVGLHTSFKTGVLFVTVPEVDLVLLEMFVKQYAQLTRKFHQLFLTPSLDMYMSM